MGAGAVVGAPATLDVVDTWLAVDPRWTVVVFRDVVVVCWIGVVGSGVGRVVVVVGAVTWKDAVAPIRVTPSPISHLAVTRCVPMAAPAGTGMLTERKFDCPPARGESVCGSSQRTYHGPQVAYPDPEAVNVVPMGPDDGVSDSVGALVVLVTCAALGPRNTSVTTLAAIRQTVARLPPMVTTLV